MTELRTRHLIVTLPDTTGDEVDAAIGPIGNAAHAAVYTDRDPGLTVNHALGETVLAGGLPGVRARRFGGFTQSRIDVMIDRGISADEARQLAGALLTLAHDIDLA